MTTTESPTDTGDCSHIDVTQEEFERRLAAHGHEVDEIHHLWEELAAMEPAAPSRAPLQRGASERLLGFGPVIAVYLGLLLVAAASVSLLAIYWDSLGATGVLALAVVYLTGYLGAGEVLRRRGLIATLLAEGSPHALSAAAQITRGVERDLYAVGLTRPERTAVLACFEDPPDGLVELRGVLMREQRDNLP